MIVPNLAEWDIIRTPASDPFWVVFLLIGSRVVALAIGVAWFGDMAWRARRVAGSFFRPPWKLSWGWSLTGFLLALDLALLTGITRVLLAGHIRDQTAIGQGQRVAEIAASLHFAAWMALAYRRWRRPNTAAIDDEQLGRATVRAHAHVVAQLDGTIIHANAAFLKLWGGAKADLVGQNLMVIMPTRYRQLHKDGLRRYVKTGIPHIIGTAVPLDMLLADGTEIPIHLKVIQELFGGNECFIGTVSRRDLDGKSPVSLN